MTMDNSERAPEPPYHAVIFVSRRTPGDAGYGAAAERMHALVQQEPGFIGMESARGADGKGITVAFFESEAAIHAWGGRAEHRGVQADGRRQWYEEYQIYYSRVESVRRWTKTDGARFSSS
jgi:heme-degrading monooxygenase HmoA